VTRDEFRQLARSLAGAVENAHQNHPDFRVGKRIFATMDYPRPGYAMVKLTPDQQEMLMQSEPAIFSAASGAWGRGGATLICLENADEPTAKSALQMARNNLKP
jgi:hypothetical protein